MSPPSRYVIDCLFNLLKKKPMCLLVSVLDYKNIMVNKLNVVIAHTAYIQFHWTI